MILYQIAAGLRHHCGSLRDAYYQEHHILHNRPIYASMVLVFWLFFFPLFESIHC